MIWEWIATITAGLGATGIALGLRAITAKRLPRWAVPVLAGTGMLAFQIIRDYTWHSDQRHLLPEGVDVVTVVEQRSVLRPWTLLYPQIVRFAAIELKANAVNLNNPELVLAQVYLFQRHYPAVQTLQVFDCKNQARADFTNKLEIPDAAAPLGDQWHLLPEDDRLLRAACSVTT